MQRLCRITVPGLSVRRDFTAARRRLLVDFPDIQEVVATTTPGTLVVVCSGSEDVEAWLDALLESVTTDDANSTKRPLRWRGRGIGGDDSAA
ncbi:MAG: hypothetical protein JWM66_428 [Solirubrobacterales bacterium]|jgi:hypothetical protein|nr:hypothetical protein [Solirubrobacterales bacterium]